jgi:uncharacterized protein (TIGR03435 family)
MRMCLWLVLVAAVWGQGGDGRFHFEVASVKPSAKQGMVTKMTGGPGKSDPGRFTATNAELSALIMRAYGIQYDQLRGPAWMDTIQFDVIANVPPRTTAEQFRNMLQNLLAERFRMQVHHETQSQPVYELTVAKNGPKLKPAAEDRGTDDFVPGSGPHRMDRDSFPLLPPGRPNNACGHLAQSSYCTFRMLTMGMLVQRLSLPSFVDRRVVDKTGLVGRYDFTLHFSHISGQSPGSDDDAPSIERAVQQQLGVKLSASNALIEVLVIDHAEKTVTEN